MSRWLFTLRHPVLAWRMRYLRFDRVTVRPEYVLYWNRG
jgi:hypothetical protein